MKSDSTIYGHPVTWSEVVQLRERGYLEPDPDIKGGYIGATAGIERGLMEVRSDG